VKTQVVSQNEVQAPVAAVNLTGLPVQGATPAAPTPELSVVAPMTPAEIEAAALKAFEDAQAKKAKAIAKFDAVVPFRLEQETVGARALSKSVSKAGAVKVAIASKKECAAQSGLKGGDLDAWMRMRSDELKNDQSKVSAALSGDNNWSGKEIQFSAKGDVITMKWKKVLPQTVTLSAPTNETMAKELGITVEAVVAMKAKAAADKKAEADLAAEAAAAKR